VILFSTGRGTPLETAVPTVKIATNHTFAVKKANWIDFDAFPILAGEDITEQLMDCVLCIAKGELSKN